MKRGDIVPSSHRMSVPELERRYANIIDAERVLQREVRHIETLAAIRFAERDR
jgi:hypothetical protein